MFLLALSVIRQHNRSTFCVIDVQSTCRVMDVHKIALTVCRIMCNPRNYGSFSAGQLDYCFRTVWQNCGHGIFLTGRAYLSCNNQILRVCAQHYITAPWTPADIDLHIAVCINTAVWRLWAQRDEIYPRHANKVCNKCVAGSLV